MKELLTKIQQRLKAPNSKSLVSFRALLIVAGVLLFFAIVIPLGTYLYFAKDLPEFFSIEDYRPRGVTQVVSGQPPNQTVIGEFYKERRYLLPIDEIPDILLDAFVSAEDGDFYDHDGINPIAILRAAVANFKAGHVVQGGSTITQQVARTLFLSREKSISRKAKEAILAYRLESNLSKKEILYLYLNQIYLGHGAYGVQAASRAFFRKNVQDIELQEAAILAAMPRAPGRFSPYLSPKRAKERQKYVLRRMRDRGKITEEQMIEAIEKPVKIYRYEGEKQFEHSAYYLENIRRYLLDKYGEKLLYDEGMKVYVPDIVNTTKVAQEAVRRGLREVDKRRGYRGALRHLASEEEINQFIESEKEKILREKAPYQIFHPDGEMRYEIVTQLEKEAAVKRLEELKKAQGGTADPLAPLADLEKIEQYSYDDLLVDGENYEALVTKIDDRKKLTWVQVGGSELVIRFDDLKWAHGEIVDPNLKIIPPRPNFPSDVLKRGDVVLVRLKPWEPEIDEKTKKPVDPPEHPPKWLAELDQVPEVQGALFSMDVRTGEVLAMEGGFDFRKSEFNRAMQAKRQTGSSFKPVIYSSALEKGYTPATIIVDSPIVYETEEYGKWKPENFEEKFYGDTTFHFSFIHSRNIPTIKIVQDIGVEHVINFAHRLGLTCELNRDLSISLGSAATSLKEMTEVYSIFPRQGKKIKPVFITRVEDRDGLILEDNQPDVLQIPIQIPEIVVAEDENGEKKSEEENKVANPDKDAKIIVDEVKEVHAKAAPPPDPREKVDLKLPTYPLEEDPDQVLDPRIAFIMTHLMEDVVNYGTGRRAKALNRISGGKTGTTNDYKDAWYIGFTQNVVTGVWVGFDDFKPLGPGETGSRAALPIWLDFMKEATKNYEEQEFVIPNGISLAYIDHKSGKRTEQSAPRSRFEAFIAGTEPTERATIGGEPQVETQSEFLKEDFEQ